MTINATTTDGCVGEGIVPQTPSVGFDWRDRGRRRPDVRRAAPGVLPARRPAGGDPRRCRAWQPPRRTTHHRSRSCDRRSSCCGRPPACSSGCVAVATGWPQLCSAGPRWGSWVACRGHPRPSPPRRSRGVGWEITLRMAAALLPAVALHLLLGLADGRLATPIRRNTVLVGYVVGAVTGLVLLADRTGW